MSQYQQFTLEGLAEVFRALGNPHRLRILAQLADCCSPGGRKEACGAGIRRGEMRVGELGDGLEIVPSTLSHHVKELSRAGLLRCDKRGKCVLCCAHSDVLRRIGKLFLALAGDETLPPELLGGEQKDQGQSSALNKE